MGYRSAAAATRSDSRAGSDSVSAAATTKDIRRGNYRRRRRSSGSAYCQKIQDEYLRAFKSQSYIAIWARVQNHVKVIQTRPKPKSAVDYSDLLEPKQDFLVTLLRDPAVRLYGLLHEYFDASVHACNSCGSLLEAIHLARQNHRILRRTLHLDVLKGIGTLDCCQYVISDLVRFSELTNPFACSSLNQFNRINGVYSTMMQWLMVAHQRALRPRRRRNLVLELATIFPCGAAGAIIDRWTATQEQSEEKAAQLDAAARGAFALDRDLDTLSRMVRRLCDEIEHGKEIIGLVKAMRDDRESEGERKLVLLRRVTRELQLSEGSFMDQLTELEGHVYLCFLNINRARAMVLEEIVGPDDGNC